MFSYISAIERRGATLRDLRNFRYLLAIAEARSFTRAAERLNVAQPWLSARIRQMETELGLTLFDRNTRRVELTPAGEILADKAVQVLKAVDQFESTAGALRNERPRLTIAMPPYATQIPVTRRLTRALRAAHPEFLVEVDVGWSHSLIPKLADGKIDAALVLAESSHAGTEEITLAEIFVEIEFDADDPLAAAPAIRPADLAGRSIVVFPRAPNPRLFHQLYGRIETAGGVFIEREGAWTFRELAEARPPGALLAAPTIGSRPAPGPNRVIRRLADNPPSLFKLVRMKGRASAALDILFDIAGALTFEPSRGAAL